MKGMRKRVSKTSNLKGHKRHKTKDWQNFRKSCFHRYFDDRRSLWFSLREKKLGLSFLSSKLVLSQSSSINSVLQFLSQINQFNQFNVYSLHEPVQYLATGCLIPGIGPGYSGKIGVEREGEKINYFLFISVPEWYNRSNQNLRTGVH